DLRSTGPNRSTKCRYRGSDIHMVIAPRGREASAQRASLSMGITFYVVQTRQGDFLPAQLPPHDVRSSRGSSQPGAPNDRRIEQSRPNSGPNASQDAVLL